MDKEILRAIHESRVFKIGNSFLFAVQIPDDSVGGSSSRCSNCNNKTVYSNQICRKCQLPFIGPFGFPQLPKWEALSPKEKRTMVEEIYCHCNNRGRIEYTNAENVPLTLGELAKVEGLRYHDADLFLSAHEVVSENIREILLT